MDEQTPHPARFSRPILDAVYKVVGGAEHCHRVLDPFAGVGSIHELARHGFDTVGVELEPEWADQNERTVVGDSRFLFDMYNDGTLGHLPFDAVVTSPAYGNRMADSYAGDKRDSKRHTYRIALGRPLAAANGAGMQWGEGYRQLHRQVWEQCQLVTRDGGLIVVNVSNHIRDGEEQAVVEWHLRTLIDLGYFIDSVEAIQTRRMRYGQNGEARVRTEKLIVGRKHA